MTGGTALSTLSAGATSLSGLSVTGNTSLSALSAGATSLSSLSVTGNTSLSTLSASNVSVSGTLGVTGATTLGSLSAGSTSLANLTVGSTGSVTAPAYYHSSDARLKADIRPIGDPLDKLLSIRGVEFNWKNDGRPDMGVVAQNVADVFPSVVTKDKNGMMAVEYDSLVGPMIEAIRVLKADNESIKAENQAIKAQLANLSVELQRVKNETEPTNAMSQERRIGSTNTAQP